MHLTIQQAWDKNLIRYLASQVVHEPISSLEKLVGGGCYNYEINHHIIMKLPMNDTIWQEWVRQAILAPTLQQHLSVQIPLFRLHSLSLQGDNLLSGICYEKIDGEAIPCHIFKSLKRADKVKIMEQVSDVMTELHAINPDKVGVVIPRYNDYDSPFQHGLKGKGRILHQFILSQLNHKNGPDKKEVLCHTDLHSENLCVKSNKLVGLLDFDLMIRATPTAEFRPNLYSSSDLALWAEIYQHRSGYALNHAKITEMSYFWMGIRTLFRAYSFLNPKCLRSKIANKWMFHRLKKDWDQTR